MRQREIEAEQKRERTIDIIIEKHKNPRLNLIRTLEQAGIAPHSFYNCLVNPKRLAKGASEERSNSLESIVTNAEHRSNVFRMDYEFLKMQFDDIEAGRSEGYIEGTFFNQQNVEDLIYISMTRHTPSLGSKDRKKVIDALSRQKSNMMEYLEITGASGIYKTWKKRFYGKEANEKDISIMELFDNARRRIKKDKSIFDLDHKQHANLWEFYYGVKKRYFEDTERASYAAFKVLSNHNRRLKSKRETAIEELKKLKNPKNYFKNLGLADLMKEGYEGRYKGSELAVLKAFDDGYRDFTGNERLFEVNAEPHLHERDFHLPLSYWNDRLNCKREVYSALGEYDKRFWSRDVGEAIDAFREAKAKGSLKDILSEIGLASLRSKVGSNLAVFKIYDEARLDKGMASVFDIRLPKHIHDFEFSSHYIRKPKKLKEAIEHLLGEARPTLLKGSRKTIVSRMPNRPLAYMASLGLPVTRHSKKSINRTVVSVVNESYKDNNSGPDLLSAGKRPYFIFDNLGRLHKMY